VKQFENAKSKIIAKYKLSDGVSIIIAMVLEQIFKKMHNHVPLNAVIEFSGYMKNKINDKHLIIFQRPPKIVAQPNMMIGDPIEFEKRKERGDFE